VPQWEARERGLTTDHRRLPTDALGTHDRPGRRRGDLIQIRGEGERRSRTADDETRLDAEPTRRILGGFGAVLRQYEQALTHWEVDSMATGASRHCGR